MQLQRQAAFPLRIGHLKNIDLRHRAGDIEQRIDPAEGGQDLIDHRLREMDLAKPPGVAETIDWVRTLDFLGAADLDPQTAEDTLGAVVKERDDLDLVRDNLEEITSGA